MISKTKTYYCYTAKNVEGKPFSDYIAAESRNQARMKFAMRYDLPYIDTRAREIRKGDIVAVICHGCSSPLSYYKKQQAEQITALNCPHCGYENWILPKEGTLTQKWVQKETL